VLQLGFIDTKQELQGVQVGCSGAVWGRHVSFEEEDTWSVVAALFGAAGCCLALPLEKEEEALFFRQLSVGVWREKEGGEH
jgi:hypothetical protein